MMRRRWLVAITLSSIGCASDGANTVDSARRSTAAKVDVGQLAPAYHAVSLTGDSVSLAGYRGKVVLLNVWATWCGPCRSEIPQLRLIDAKYRGRGLRLVGVTIDAEGMEPQIADFVREFRMTYAIWRDPNERVSAQFRILGVPATFLIDRRGIVRWKTIGPVAPGDTTLDVAITRALES